MDYYLSEEQRQQLLEDGWIRLNFGKRSWMYAEFESYASLPQYIEIVVDEKETHHSTSLCCGIENLAKSKPEKPKACQGYINIKRCPRCHEPMNYRYTYCPVCGQKIDWSEVEYE